MIIVFNHTYLRLVLLYYVYIIIAISLIYKCITTRYHSKGTHPMRTYAAVVHGLLRNELQLWTKVFEMRTSSSMRAYVSICCTIVNEMQATLFPSPSDSTKEGTKTIKAKPLNDFGSSQINKQVDYYTETLDF